MSIDLRNRIAGFGSRSQKGVATLLVTLSILIILTIIILASTNVALFEQKTATNENRGRLAEQAAEYALNIAGEYLKANVSKISTTAVGGWRHPNSLHWIACTTAAHNDATHPCAAAGSNYAELFYYTTDGLAHAAGSAPQLDLAYDSLAPVGIKLATTGAGAPGYATTGTKVRALLCLLDTGLTPAACRLVRTSGQRIAVTLVAEGKLSGESSTAVVKETWGTLSSNSFNAATPLVAAGTINIVGTFTMVSAPNAGGYGVKASVWSAQDAGGTGSWQTCQAEDYLGSYAEADLMTQAGCADIHANPKCLCDTAQMSTGGNPDGVDILDRGDGGMGAGGVLPDITFFPGSSDFSSQIQRDATRLDYRVCTGAGAPYTDCTAAGACPPSHPFCLIDDNLFEYTFGKDVTGGDSTVVATNCAMPAGDAFNPAGAHNGDCELKALKDLNFKAIANCSSLNSASSGLIYVTGACDLNDGSNIIGSVAAPVILVVDNNLQVGHTDNFFGMLFVRSPPQPLSPNNLNTATVNGNASGKFFGSIIIEGVADHLNGTMDLVYMDTSAGSPDDPLPDSTRFARLPGSWLDNVSAF